VEEQGRPPVVATWADIPSEVVRPGVRRRGFGNEGAILVLNEVAPGMVPAPHRHEGFDQIATILSGQARYHIGDAVHHVGPGSLLLIPAGMEHWIEPAGSEPVENLDVFAPARSDYHHLLTWMQAAPSPTPE
jgi:quercetin dioxygenase-like cupin family protein